MYRDICPSIAFDPEYREGLLVGFEDSALGVEQKGIGVAWAAEYGYYGLGYSDGVELSKRPKNTSSEYFNQ